MDPKGKLRDQSLHLCNLRDEVGELLPCVGGSSDEGGSGDMWSLLKEDL